MYLADAAKGLRRYGDPRKLPVVILVSISFSYPVVICAVFFPTPHSDLREQINFGLHLLLQATSHPPLQNWAAGLIASSGARDAWSYVLAAQVLNFAGIWYLWRTARDFISQPSAITSVVAICSSSYFIAGVPSRALNADDLLFFLWSALLYHALQAFQGNRLRDWAAAGIFGGLSLITKYTSIVFIVGLLTAVVLLPGERRPFANPRAYFAGLICVVIFSTCAAFFLGHSNTVQHALRFLHPDAGIDYRVGMLALFLGSILLLGLPFVAGLAISAWRGEVRVESIKRPFAMVIVATAVTSLGLVVILILAGGLDFSMRYITPFVGIMTLAALSKLSLRPGALRACLRLGLGTWLALLVVSAVYAMTFVNERMREPAPAAAKMIGDDWDARFPCGPAYIVGFGPSAYGISLYFRHPIMALDEYDLFVAALADKEKLQEAGAIVIGTPSMAGYAAFLEAFPHRTQQVDISLPYRRTFSMRRHSYTYFFVPPAKC